MKFVYHNHRFEFEKNNGKNFFEIIAENSTPTEVGEGNMDWQPIIKICEDINVKWYAVEQDTCYRDPFESLEISLANIRKW